MHEENAIEVRNITKEFKIYYDKGTTLKEKVLFKKRRKFEVRKVLNGISFEVKKGEAIGLIGQNGCGKSTTLKLLTKIMYPDSGTIEMRGRVSSLLELGAGFHPDMSGRENIYINASIFGLSRKEIDERLSNIIAFSELEEYIDNPVRTYSSGMYMRLAFSVAINVDADILLIDEILAVGDANFQAKCFNKLRELKEYGMTIVLVTHDSGAVERFCNRAIWINNGVISNEGNPANVIEHYLTYMNNKKLININCTTINDKDLINLKNQEKYELGSIEMIDRVVIDKSDFTLESDILNRQSLDYNVKHFGLGTAMIEKVFLKDQFNREIDTLEAGNPFLIEYIYQVAEQVNELVFGMGIYTIDGKWIFGTNTLLSEIKIEPKIERSKIVYVGDELNLLTGRYILQVSITDINGQALDFYREYLQFDVINAHKDAGLVYMKNHWIVEEV